MADCPSGLPDDLYDMPEDAGNMPLLKLYWYSLQLPVYFIGIEDYLKHVDSHLWDRAMREKAHPPPPFYSRQMGTACG